MVQCSFSKFNCFSFSVIIHMVREQATKSLLVLLPCYCFKKTQFFMYLYTNGSKHILTDFTAHLKLKFTAFHLKDFYMECSLRMNFSMGFQDSMSEMQKFFTAMLDTLYLGSLTFFFQGFPNFTFGSSFLFA